MANCFVGGNTTDAAAGLGGGGISLYTAQPCSFVNCTFSGNLQQSPNGFGGGAIYVENFNPIGELPIRVIHCTFAGNDDLADSGSSIHANVFGTFVTVRNSIFADGLGRNLEVAGAARIVSQGGNISDDPSTTTLTQGGEPELITFLNQPSDRRNTDPLLSGVSLSLQAGSAGIGLAIDPADEIPNPLADRIGVIRGNDPDAGALEFNSFARLIIPIPSTPMTLTSSSFTSSAIPSASISAVTPFGWTVTNATSLVPIQSGSFNLASASSSPTQPSPPLAHQSSFPPRALP
jgi:hypothetical protein